jgi:hypothetical protein
MAHDQQPIEQPERDGRNHKQVHRRDPICLVAQKRLPTLRRRTSPARHILGNAGLPDIDPELEQFAVDTRIALLWFLLTLFASPLKSKSRLEVENAALRYQLIVLRRKMRGRCSDGGHENERNLRKQPRYRLEHKHFLRLFKAV